MYRTYQDCIENVVSKFENQKLINHFDTCFVCVFVLNWELVLINKIIRTINK
jgi:hypothetical protein